MNIHILQGKELTTQDIESMNEARLKEFGSTVPIKPESGNEDWTKFYFLAKKDGKLVAFGRLHDVDVTIGNEIHSILGIATVIALEKGQGYGKEITLALRDYIKKSGKTGLGFCDKKVTPFYKKCGFNILINGVQKFTAATPPRFPKGDAIYLSGKDDFIDKLIQNPTLTAKLSKPHW